MALRAPVCCAELASAIELEVINHAGELPEALLLHPIVFCPWCGSLVSREPTPIEVAQGRL